MNHKIVKLIGCKTAKEALLSVFRDEEKGQETVEIQIWHTHEDGDYYQVESIEFPSLDMARNFITDYSQKSACDLAESFSF